MITGVSASFGEITQNFRQIARAVDDANDEGRRSLGVVDRKKGKASYQGEPEG